MESQQQLANNEHAAAASEGRNTTTSNYLCRQSSTRWTPTTDQIRILKDLYYNNGVRSPSAEQIQRISAKLRQYGKIEGKNVFYWFQNHKARERQKKRFTAEIPAPMQYRTAANNTNNAGPNWKNIEDLHHLSSPPIYNKFSNHIISPSGNFASSSSASSSPGLLTVGNYGYGSLAMEKSFRECSITPNNGNAGGSMGHQNFAWIGVDPYHFLEKKNYNINGADQTPEMEEEEDHAAAAANLEIETLPLFPMHGDDIINKQEIDYFNGWHRHADDAAAVAGARASLELTLNSYAAGFPSS